MVGLVVDMRSLSSLSTPTRYSKMVDLTKFTNNVLKLIDKEGANADSRITDNCKVLWVVNLCVVNKGVDAEGVACLKLVNNQNGLVCQEFKNIYILYQTVVVVGL